MRLVPCFVLLASLLPVAAFAASSRIERTVEKTFTVPGSGVLHVATQGGQIRVLPGTGSTVQVSARERIRADSDAEADDLLKKLDLTIEQTGNDVSATARYESQPLGFRF